MLGLLRRLLRRGVREPKAEQGNTGAPRYVRQDQENVAAARIESARQRLKETIPPPEDGETGAG